MTNVAGQARVPTIVAKREGLLDQATYDGDRASDPIGEAQQQPLAS